MRIEEIFESAPALLESVTFSVAKLVNHEKHGQYYDTDHFSQEEMVQCWVCDGTGMERGHECDMCDGKKEIKEYIYPYKRLNVSNDNALQILDMVQANMRGEYAGALKKEELPVVRRRLVQLMNQGADQHTQEPSVDRGQMGANGTNGNVYSIGRQGPTMYHMGRSQDQVNRYIQSLLNIIDFAQKNDAVVVWN